METFITNPGKRKGKGKSSRKGGKRNRKNPTIMPNGKKRGRANRGARRNPGFQTFIPGAIGGLSFRAILKLATGDEGIRGPDGKLTTKALGVGALALYFGDKIASTLKQTGSDAIAFEGGEAGVAASLIVDDKLPDLARDYLAPMVSPAAGAPTGAGHGLAGLGRERPLSLAAYQALAGTPGALPAIGAVVYVQGADGAVYEVPTASGTSGPAGETITIPNGVRPGQVIRSKRSGARYRIGRDGNGNLYAEQIGMSGSVADYQSAA